MTRKPRSTMREKGRNIVKAMNNGEPVADGPVTKFWLVGAYNWYSSNTEPQDAIKWLNQYIGKNMFPAKTETPAVVMLGYITRLLSRGVEVPESTRAFLKQKLLELTPKKEAPIPVASKTIQDRVRERTDMILGMLDIRLDQYCTTFKDPGSLKTFLYEHDPKGLSVKAIITKFKPIMEEVAAAALKKDPELVEAYSCYSEVRLRDLAKFLARMITDSNEFLNTGTVKANKPRKVKPLNLEKTFAKFKYATEHAELKLTSVNPYTIHNSKMLWVYNLKYNKFGYYVAEEGKKLTVTGSTILNYDEVKSVCRTIRKPDLIAAENNAAYLVSLFKNQKTAITPQRGRIGSDTVLVKVI